MFERFSLMARGSRAGSRVSARKIAASGNAVQVLLLAAVDAGRQLNTSAGFPDCGTREDSVFSGRAGARAFSGADVRVSACRVPRFCQKF